MEETGAMVQKETDREEIREIDTTISELQNDLVGALIGLCRACGNNPKTENTDKIIIEGLCTSMSYMDFDEQAIRDMINRVHAEKDEVSPGCSHCMSRCGNTDDYNIRLIWREEEDTRSLKSLLLLGIQEVASFAYIALDEGKMDTGVNEYLTKALNVLSFDYKADELLKIVMELDEVRAAAKAMIQ